MNAESWQQLETHFHAALELGPAKRAAFLATACDGNVELRRQVEGLLASHDESGDFLVSPALVNAGTVSDVPLETVEPDERESLSDLRDHPRNRTRRHGHSVSRCARSEPLFWPRCGP